MSNHITVSGTSVGERAAALRDGILWGALKVFVIGGMVVSVPGVLLGATIPGEGLTRTETITQNLTNDHTQVWEWIGQGAQGVGEFMNERG